MFEGWQFFLVSADFHVYSIDKDEKWVNFHVKLHGLMDNGCYAKGPQIESYSGDIRKIYFWRNLLFFKFFFEKITFSIKNCHPSNTFWLYQLRVRTPPIKCYSHLKSENFKWNTLYNLHTSKFWIGWTNATNLKSCVWNSIIDEIIYSINSTFR